MRKKLLVKPKLQLKYVFLSVLLVLFSAVLSYWIMTREMTRSPFTENLSFGEVTALRQEIRIVFFWVALLLALSVSIQSIVFFHRLIGPIYVLEKMFQLMRTGDLRINLKLRKNDELKDLAEGLEDIVKSYSSWIGEDRKRIEAVKARLSALKGKISDQEAAALMQDLDQVTGHFQIENS